MNEPDPTLAAYAKFLHDHHLDDVVEANLAIAGTMDIPLMRLFAHLSPAELHALSRQGLGEFLAGLAAGTALEAQARTLRAWEADELPGLPRDAIEPSDLVLVNAAQRAALIRLIPRYTADQATTLAIVEALDHFYQVIQERTFKLFTQLREQAAQRAARLEAEKEEIAVQIEELEDEVVRRTSELADERRFIEVIVANVPTALAYLDRGLRYRWVNPAFAALLGRPVKDFIGQTAQQMFGLDDGQAIAEAALREGRTIEQREFPFTLKVDGHTRESWWDAMFVPLLDGHDEPEGAILIAQEVTDRVERTRLKDATIAQLREVDRMKDEFLSVISHELRTPLNFIMGFASLLEDEIPGPVNAEQRRYVERILGGADRMLLLVQDLLDYAAMQAGRFSLQRHPVAPRALIEEVVATLRPLANQYQVTLCVADTPDDPVDVDGARLVQVLTNLASNGLKFTPAGGTVTLDAAFEATPGGRKLVMCVRDTGIGIAGDDIPKLFTRFQQLNMGPTREAGGTGLGLSIVKALVEAHGGTIGVKSVPGKGSTFRFELPLT